MDDLLKWHGQKKAHVVVEGLKERKMNGHFAETSQKALDMILELLDKDSVIAWGGSMTLEKLGIKDVLRKEGYKIIDTEVKGLSRTEVLEKRRESLLCDIYLTGTNAITLDGKLVNIDLYGNRVGAMMYGPKKVIVVTGTHKIVHDEEAALQRIKEFTAPVNSRRLKRKTPCAETGFCHDCNSPDRICGITTVIEWQADADRLHVVMFPEEAGL